MEVFGVKPKKTLSKDQLSRKLRQIEGKIEELQYTLDDLKSLSPSAAPPPTEEAPQSLRPPGPVFPEPFFYPPERAPFLQQPPARKVGLIDDIIQLLNDPEIQQIVQMLTKKWDSDHKKGKPRP